jgi:hypothetical protein
LAASKTALSWASLNLIGDMRRGPEDRLPLNATPDALAM